jgi:formamidopyrimidine-DNA glycosylase
MTTADATIYLTGPTVCELIDPDEEAKIRRRLGPDPLSRRASAEMFTANLSRRRIPIGAAILDQKVIAGVGNVYRAELLFLLGVAPQTPANRLKTRTATALWERTVAELRRGEKSGRIVTTDPGDFGANRDRDLDPDERLYVYKRDGLPCRRCATEIRITEMANRSMWWCPSCQSNRT